MAYSVDTRVQVSDQSSEHRNRYGTVLSASGDDHQVRLDGHRDNQAVLLRTDQLRTTTQASPVEY